MKSEKNKTRHSTLPVSWRQAETAAVGALRNHRHHCTTSDRHNSLYRHKQLSSVRPALANVPDRRQKIGFNRVGRLKSTKTRRKILTHHATCQQRTTVVAWVTVFWRESAVLRPDSFRVSGIFQHCLHVLLYKLHAGNKYYKKASRNLRIINHICHSKSLLQRTILHN